MEASSQLPEADLYLIYSISNSPYQRWQAELLDFSAWDAGQPGEIIRLCSQDASYPGRDVPEFTGGTTFATPSFAGLGDSRVQRCSQWVKRLLGLRPHGRFHFFCLNKPFAMRQFLEAHPALDGQARLLWLDPDMVFARPWVPEAADVGGGRVAGQRWWGFDPDWCLAHAERRYHAAIPDEADALMYPFCISVEDMRRISGDFCHLARQLYRRTRDWKSEMYALVLALGAAGLKCNTARALATCNDWPGGLPDDAAAPIAHYTQPMKDHSGAALWDKRAYTPETLSSPWGRPPAAEQAATLADRRALGVLHRFIDRQEAGMRGSRADGHGLAWHPAP